jgi:hypothetical protein
MKARGELPNLGNSQSDTQSPTRAFATETPAQILENEQARRASAAAAARQLASSYRGWRPIEIHFKQRSDFDRRMCLARLRWNLMNECPATIERMRGEGVTITGATLEAALLLLVADVRPRSRIVPWDLNDETVIAMIAKVAADWMGTTS